MAPDAFRSRGVPVGCCNLRLRAWSGWTGVLFMVTTGLSMLASAQWECRLVLADPLAWMMLILAAAAGASTGYALGYRLRCRRAAP